jgi:hypothetical protein
LENFVSAAKEDTELLQQLKLTAKASKNPDEIRQYIELAKEIDRQIIERFEMLFPTGVDVQKCLEHNNYKRFEYSLKENKRAKIYNESRPCTSGTQRLGSRTSIDNANDNRRTSIDYDVNECSPDSQFMNAFPVNNLNSSSSSNLSDNSGKGSKGSDGNNIGDRLFKGSKTNNGLRVSNV